MAPTGNTEAAVAAATFAAAEWASSDATLTQAGRSFRRRRPAVRQQLFEAGVELHGRSPHHVAKVGERVVAVEPGGLHQAHNRRPGPFGRSANSLPKNIHAFASHRPRLDLSLELLLLEIGTAPSSRWRTCTYQWLSV